MKLARPICTILCLLLVTGIIGCGPNPQTPTPLSQSSAGLVVKLSIEEMTTMAQSILVGNVTHIANYQGDKGYIYTQITLSVEQTIKGETRGGVIITVPGGEVNGHKMLVEDAPSFQLGERAMVFLEEPDGTFVVVGGFQGKYTIDKNNMVGGTTSLAEFIQQLRGIMANR